MTIFHFDPVLHVNRITAILHLNDKIVLTDNPLDLIRAEAQLSD